MTEAFQIHANAEVQKPPSQATNPDTEKHTKRIDIHKSQITNHDLLNPVVALESRTWQPKEFLFYSQEKEKNLNRQIFPLSPNNL